jgi:threonylcarbamoyladenosine tRNA methylthiotransferase MtaB
VPGGLKVFFGIDVIVGFPGETDELFEETYTFLRDVVRPAFIHIFPYSRRVGTPAADRKDQVQDSVKTLRVQRLEALCQELHEEFMQQHKGMNAHVLFESTDRKGMMEGYTENYIRMSVPFDPEKIGKIVEVTI